VLGQIEQKTECGVFKKYNNSWLTMKHIFYFLGVFLLIIGVIGCQSNTNQIQEIERPKDSKAVETHIGQIRTEAGSPVKESAQLLYDELDYTSAVNAYVWAMPFVNLAGYFAAGEDVFEAEWGQFVALPTTQDRRGTLTPTTTSTYIFAMAKLSETGPLVVEDPQGNTVGIIIDMWQRVMTENGVAGPFKGKGGKFLFLGPNMPDEGYPEEYHVIRSTTNHLWIGWRFLDEDKEKAIAELGPKLKVYSYSKRDNPPTYPVILGNSRKWTQTPPEGGIEYFERLARYIKDEPVAERDRFMMAQLKTLGIEVGKPFEPDERQTAILTKAAKIGRITMDAATAHRRGTSPWWEGKQWKRLFVYPHNQRDEHFDHFEERAILYWEIFGYGITTTKPGTGSAYTVTHIDGEGKILDGGKSYVLQIPANIPVANFWSVCAYDVRTRTFIEGTNRVMIGSQEPGYKTNDDGTIDVYFGPDAPAGFENNWVQTIPGKGWFSYFRFFGPTEPFLNKSWVLPDFEELGQ
jgi:hypothetical protein